jgi:hypothetical protein
MLEAGYVASAQGVDFEAVLTNDPDAVDLIWRGQAPSISGFEEVAPEIYVRHVALSELDSVRRIQWRCEYQGEPFIVSADRGDNLLISYAGRNFQKAATLGLRVEDRDYIVGLVPRSDVSNLRKVEKRIWPAE